MFNASNGSYDRQDSSLILCHSGGYILVMAHAILHISSTRSTTIMEIILRDFLMF